MRTVGQFARLISITPYLEELIEKAARLCYDKKPGKEVNREFIASLIRRGHESVIEHASATFLIQTNRAIANEIVRHRIASYSQVSTRYVNFKECEFIKPVFKSGQSYKHWRESCIKAEEAYRALIESGEPPEMARDVLPLCLATRLVMTANFREWRHFIKLRASKKAHYQIWELAVLILYQLRKSAPSVFWDLVDDPDNHICLAR